jgi:hypothetical protein
LILPHTSSSFLDRSDRSIDPVPPSEGVVFCDEIDWQAGCRDKAHDIRSFDNKLLQTLDVTGALEKGQSVLIHSGASGTRQAAMQIAKLYDAEIFTTASSPDKRTLLCEI